MEPSSSDRRAYERFDVVGTLWGVLELPEPARIVNVSRSGALIDAPVEPILNSVRSLRLRVPDGDVSVEAAVRHVRPAEPGRFLVGVEFVAAPASVLTSIEQIGAGHELDLFDSGAASS